MADETKAIARVRAALDDDDAPLSPDDLRTVLTVVDRMDDLRQIAHDVDRQRDQSDARAARAERLLAFAVRELGGTVRVPATALEHVDPAELEVEPEGEAIWLEYPARTRPRRTGGQKT